MPQFSTHLKSGMNLREFQQKTRVKKLSCNFKVFEIFFLVYLKAIMIC